MILLRSRELAGGAFPEPRLGMTRESGLGSRAPIRETPWCLTDKSVCNAALIRSKQAFDCIALANDMGQLRAPPNLPAVADVLVSDDSNTNNEEFALAIIFAFG